MRHTRRRRFVVTICAVAALLALSVLPAEHLHHDSSGGAFVHRHGVDAADHVEHFDVEHLDEVADGDVHEGVSLDHAEHASATALNPRFDSPRRYDVTPSLIAAERFVGRPDLRSTGRLDRVDDPPTHGPPIRSRSLRAPPA